MKKLIEEKHDLIAGILAALAMVTIVCEMAFEGFSKESFAAGLKDLSGILIDILVLAVAASVLIRKPGNFKEKFNEAMDRLISKYEPLLVEDKAEKVIRYNIASNTDALFYGQAKDLKRIFELDKEKPTEINFYINKSFFNQRGGADYNAEEIANAIAVRLQRVYKDYDVFTFPNGTNYSIRVDFRRTMNSDDIDELVSLIDYVILLFVARNKS